MPSGLLTRLEARKEALRASFWFVPGLVTACAAALAVLLVVFQSAADETIGHLIPWLFQGEAESARSVLSSIAGSMATVAGTTFSVTMVALTLAAGQFSPRVLRGFMRDRINQFVLGGFIGTFTYALIVLRAVRNTDEGVPNLAVTVAFLFALGSMALLILFVHHIAESVQVATVLDDITRETAHQVPHLFPAPLGKGAPSEGPLPAITPRGTAARVRSDDHGYVQVLDYDGICDAAEKADVVVRVEQAPGDFVSYRAVLATVWPADRCSQALAAAIRQSLVLARYPSIEHDVQFGIRQIADIGARALSPGVNDPTTGTNCIDYLSVILAHVIGREIPSPHRRTKAGDVRVVARGPAFDRMVHLAFDQICLYGRRDPRVMRRVLESLAHLADLTGDLERRAALAGMAERAVAHLPEDLDPDERSRIASLASGVATGKVVH